jgi:signal transduction histidine kinase
LWSLRSRVIVGAVLWTLGLFAVTGVITTALLLRGSVAPVLLHRAFSHATILSALALLCMMLGLMQVRSGLAPFNRLRDRLSGVRNGQEQRVEGRYPAEVQPLVNDMNALLENRERAVTRAIAKAGDLAHGLKTPLAVLSQEADRVAAAGHSDLASAIGQQVERMRRQIDYHLAHARAAASGSASGARCSLRESAEALVRALRSLHADRGLALEADVPPEASAKVQREDLDELLGNLLDNACKWARARVVVRSAPAGEGSIEVTVDDDGPGLAESLREQVLQRGVRADEVAPGSGLGLAIVRDLSELYGGSIVLEGSPLGGLRARLRLPS